MQNAIHPADDIGSVYETNVNNAVETVATCFSGASAPGTTYACQLWADTTNNILKQRDKTNSSWVTIGALGSSIMGLVPDLNATASGSSNAFAVTVNGLYSLTAGIKVWFKANFSITGAPTLNMNGGGAVAIYKFTASGRVSVAVPDIISGQWVCVMYDGTYWIMISEVAKWDLNSLPAVSAYYNGTGVNVPQNTIVQVPLNLTLYDNQSEFSSSTYTAKYAGLYDVKCLVSFIANTPGGNMTLAIYKNSALYIFQARALSISTDVDISITMKLAVNDTISFYVLYGISAGLIGGGSNGTTAFETRAQITKIG